MIAPNIGGIKNVFSKTRRLLVTNAPNGSSSFSYTTIGVVCGLKYIVFLVVGDFAYKNVTLSVT